MEFCARTLILCDDMQLWCNRKPGHPCCSTSNIRSGGWQYRWRGHERRAELCRDIRPDLARAVAYPCPRVDLSWNGRSVRKRHGDAGAHLPHAFEKSACRGTLCAGKGLFANFATPGIAVVGRARVEVYAASVTRFFESTCVIAAAVRAVRGIPRRLRVYSPYFSAFWLPRGAPDPGAPPCIRYRRRPAGLAPARFGSAATARQHRSGITRMIAHHRFVCAATQPAHAQRAAEVSPLINSSLNGRADCHILAGLAVNERPG
jgi:hypothetical protein